MRRVALPVITAVLLSSLVASPVSPSAAQAADDPLPRVIVPLDSESAFALDPANSAPVDLGEGETGTVVLQFADDRAANLFGGYVQVFRPGDGPASDRWVGRVDIAPPSVELGEDAEFELPAGEYLLLLKGFTSRQNSVWTWYGGDYDPAAARALTVGAGGEAVIDMTQEGTDVSTVTMNLVDRYGNGLPRTDSMLYTVLERHDREELVPLGPVTSWGLDVLRGARVTAVAYGTGEYHETWYPHSPNMEEAIVTTATSLRMHLLQTAQIGVPIVRGIAAVGQDLWAEHAGLAGATHAYQWLADGVPLAGKTDTVLRVGSALAGKRISFRVHTTGMYLADSATTSLATPRVTKPATPKVSGLMLPGETMRLSPGTWPSGTKLSIQWAMNGFPLDGATGTTVVVPSDAYMATVYAIVKATRPGYETVVLQVIRDGGTGIVPHRAASGLTAEVPTGQKTGRIAGAVEGVDLAAVPDATVRVYWAGTGIERAATPTLAGTVQTDASGRFEVTDLAPGHYCLEADPPAGSRLSRIVGDCGSGINGESVFVFADATANARLQFYREARVTGTITSSTGAAVPGAVVSVYKTAWSANGYEALIKVASATANSSGRYTVGGLGWEGYHVKLAGPTSLTHRAEWWSNAQYVRSSAVVDLEPGTTKTVNASIAAYLPIGIPKISGNAIVGGTLTASHPVTSGATYRYQWSANGVAISGATKRSYSVPSSLEGRTITVTVVGARSNYLTTGRRSEATPRVLRAATPTIAGTRAVGSRLTANAGTWTTGTVFAYRWYRDGAPIDGATDRTYVLQPADRGHRLTVKIRGTKAGYASTARTSSPTWPIAR